jgi:hypothetical protein
MEKDVRNGERCMYLGCDFNGRWLKDSYLMLYCYFLKCGRYSSLICISNIFP